MFKYSKRSLGNLETCDHHLQILFNEVIKYRDCTIVCGHRSVEQQQRLYQSGRKKVGGVWVPDDDDDSKDSIVTNIDGVSKKSKHNYSESKAVDVVPYIQGRLVYEKKQCYYFGGFVMGLVTAMHLPVIWGGDWDNDCNITDQHFNDLLHFELSK